VCVGSRFSSAHPACAFFNQATQVSSPDLGIHLAFIAPPGPRPGTVCRAVFKTGKFCECVLDQPTRKGTCWVTFQVFLSTGPQSTQGLIGGGDQNTNRVALIYFFHASGQFYRFQILNFVRIMTCSLFNLSWLCLEVIAVSFFIAPLRRSAKSTPIVSVLTKTDCGVSLVATHGIKIMKRVD